ncbi:MAG: helix-turn-helix transcriptional regulator [Gemmatimonadetes bacterium]|nr:helix-turn-helix transcriptional regulator [Gemmatimonadota bacterium]
MAERPVEGCVVDPYAPYGFVSLLALRRLRQRHPTLALIIYADFHGRELQLFHLGRLGANATIMAGRDDSPAALRRIVAAALAESVASVVATALRGCVPDAELQLIQWVVEHAHDRPRVRDLAVRFGSSPATLNARLRTARLPTARRLLIWGRLLRGAQWLEDRGRTVDGIAYQLGYANGAGFRRALRRCADVTPMQVAGSGGLQMVLDEFVRTAIADGDERCPRWRRTRPQRWPPSHEPAAAAH